MTPILTITLNPALDLSTHVDHVVAGPKLRCSEPVVFPGGGGINVSRAIKILGGNSRAMVALGGSTGLRMADALAREGISFAPFPAAGETRQSLAVLDDGTGQQYRFVLPGAEWTRLHVHQALDRISEVAPEGGFVVLSGSQPPGVPVDFAARAADVLAGRARLVIDSSGPPLRHVTESLIPGLDVLRMNSEEAEHLAGRPLPLREDTANFAASLVARGVAFCVIVARGADGSVLVEEGRRLFCHAAKVPVNSKVGAGDSFLGAFVLALSQGAPSDLALAKGVAAASAAVMTEATELCRKDDAERLLAECNVVAV